MYKSINYNQSKIIQDIADLHCGGSIEVDLTYSKGTMYKDCNFVPKYKYDLRPQTSDTVKADAHNIQRKNISSIMFDPPFLATTGQSLKIADDSNKMVKRFGSFPNEKELHKFYCEVITESYSKLKNDGVLIFKCQDKVSSGKQYFSHNFICQEAIKVGFYPVDLFILLSKHRMTPKWQLKNQQHARKFHAYFWVFRKSNKKAIYV